MPEGWLSRTAIIIRYPVRFFAAGAAVITLLLPFPILYEIVAEAMRNPPTWVFEVTGYAMIMIALASSGYGLQSGHHFRISILGDRVPSLALFLRFLSAVVEVVFGAILLGAGFLQAHASYMEGVRSNTLLQVPLVWPELALPIGGLTILLQGLASLLGKGGLNKVRER